MSSPAIENNCWVRGYPTYLMGLNNHMPTNFFIFYTLPNPCHGIHDARGIGGAPAVAHGEYDGRAPADYVAA